MNTVKSGNRAISVQTKGQPLAMVAAATQAPKVMMPTEISSETTLSMVGCSSRLCRPPSRKIAQPDERYDDKADNPPWIKALAEVRRLAPREGWRYHHVQAIIVAIDQYAEAALGNREFFLNKPYGIGGSRTKDDIP